MLFKFLIMKKVLFILACAISALSFAQSGNDRQRINGSSLAKTEVAPAVSSHLSDMENANSCASDTGGGIKLPDDGKKKDFCLTSDTGGRGQTIDPGKKKDDFTASDTGGTLPGGEAKSVSTPTLTKSPSSRTEAANTAYQLCTTRAASNFRLMARNMISRQIAY